MPSKQNLKMQRGISFDESLVDIVSIKNARSQDEQGAQVTELLEVGPAWLYQYEADRQACVTGPRMLQVAP